MSLLENLLALFRVDAQVRGLTSRLRSAERFLAGQQAKLDAVEEQKHELETRRRQVQAKSGNLETEAAALAARIDKHREELNSAATNKQYSALLTEVNSLKAQKAELETQILQHMEQVESLSREIEALDAQRAERLKQREIAAQQLEERKGEVGDRLAELEREREAAAAAVPERELRLFDDLAERCEGEPMAPLETIDVRNKEYACGACNMHVPYQTVSVLRGSGNNLVRCSACQRILYFAENAKPAAAGRK